MTKKNLKTLKNNLSAGFLKTMLFMAKIIPLKGLRIIAGWVAGIAYNLAGKQRAMAISNIRFALNKDEKEAEQIARKNFSNMFRDALELLYYYHCDNKKIKSIYRLTGKDNLDQARLSKNGIIGITAHLGNFPFMGAAFALEGYRVNFVIRNIRDKKLEAIIQDLACSRNMNLIWTYPKNECIRFCIEALRKNEILILLLDQNFGTGGVFVDFFGRPAATAAGPITLARRTGAHIIPMFITRNSSGQQDIIIDKIFSPVSGPDHAGFVKTNMQILTNIIEDYVKKYPLEWNWIHNRWKAQPK